MPRRDIKLKNPESYVDRTAYDALNNIMNDAYEPSESADVRNNKLMKAIKLIIDLAGFKLIGRIAVKDKKTGRVYR